MIYVSLLFGFLAWGLEAAAVIVKQRGIRAFLVGIGFLSCCISAIVPLLIVMRRFDVGDTAAVEDTIRGLVFGVIVMMSVTLVLALIALKKLSDKR